MKVHDTELSEVKLLEPRIFADSRGFFFESYNQRTLEELGIQESFVQDNHSRSERGVLRGLHYQLNKEMLWIPAGFGHGFLVVSPVAEVLYKATDFYAPRGERSILWNDSQIGIQWPDVGAPVLSVKDAAGKSLHDAEVFA